MIVRRIERHCCSIVSLTAADKIVSYEIITVLLSLSSVLLTVLFFNPFSKDHNNKCQSLPLLLDFL